METQTKSTEERVEGQESLLKVAAIQFEPVVGQVERNRKKIVELVGKAVAEEVELMVIPELSNSGYVFNNRREAFQCSEIVPDGPTVSALVKATEVVSLESLLEPLEDRFGRLAERNIEAMRKAYEDTLITEKGS